MNLGWLIQTTCFFGLVLLFLCCGKMDIHTAKSQTGEKLVDISIRLRFPEPNNSQQAASKVPFMGQLISMFRPNSMNTPSDLLGGKVNESFAPIPSTTTPVEPEVRIQYRKPFP